MKRIVIILTIIILYQTVWGQVHSVLASGNWWRIELEESGLYRIMGSEIEGLRGSLVENIGVYGGDGLMLSIYNNQTSVDDLKSVAIKVVDHNQNRIFDAEDEIIFYGEGTDVWRYDGSDDRWEMRTHAYANTNSYFITNSAIEPTRIGKRSWNSVASNVIGTYTAVACVNNDLVSPFESGQQWLGEKFSQSIAERSFNLSLPSPATGVKVRYALANVSTASARFTVDIDNVIENTHVIDYRSVYATHLDAFDMASNTATFRVRYFPGENTAEGYLDYIELSGRVPMRFTGGQMLMRQDGIGEGIVEFALQSGSPTLLWNITDVNHSYEIDVSDNGRWADSVAGSAVYLLSDGSRYLTPVSIQLIDNQDLHGHSAADYIVVTHSRYLEQAQQLAALHAIEDEMQTMVVTDQEVYNEFSSGKQDPIAIRSLMRWLRRQHPNRPPKYLVLFGKANYDNRNRLGNDLTTVAIYESPQSFDDEGSSFCSDDMLGYLDENEYGTSSQGLDIAIGRLPAKNEDEATRMVNKIGAYMHRLDLAEGQARGDWRNYVALLSDDADPGKPGDTSFVHSSEQTAKDIQRMYPTYNIDRLYADAYHQQSGAIGSFYPDLNNALTQRMNYGCLLINYIGHGSAAYIGTERFIEHSDIEAYSNTNRLPLFITSTCSYGHLDHPENISGAEAMMLAPAAAIAVVSAGRKIPHIHRFNNTLILNALGGEMSIGEALRTAKNRVAVSQSIGLIGDPALKLSLPQHQIKVTQIDNHTVADGCNDTAIVLSRVTISGEVQYADGTLINDFNGRIFPIVFDREVQTSTLANDNSGTEVVFNQQKNILYKGNEAVVGGRFEYSFIVPRDVAYQYDYAKLSHYATAGSEDAAGYYGRLMLGGLNEDVVIGDNRPKIELFIGDTNFRSGGIVDQRPMLIARLSDSVGINAVGSGIGHDITAVLDDNASGLIVLNDFYEPDVDDPRSGMVRYRLSDISTGQHSLFLKAWNIYNLSNFATISFTVHDSSEVAISALTCYPNPATTYTTFHFEVNSPQQITSAVLIIYNMKGQKVAEFRPAVSSDSYVIGPIRWDIPRRGSAVYPALMMVTTRDGKVYRSSIKCITK